MRSIRLLVITLAFVGATACGLSVTGTGPGQSQDSNNPISAGSTTALDGAVDPDASATPAATSFVCGSETCTTGIQACCSTGATFTCSAADAGCPAADGGAPAPPPIWCTSSSQCNGERSCCYSPTTGSTCSKSCASDQVELCDLQKGCGENAKCVAMGVAAAPGVGQCQYDEGG